MNSEKLYHGIACGLAFASGAGYGESLLSRENGVGGTSFFMPRGDGTGRASGKGTIAKCGGASEENYTASGFSNGSGTA